MAAKVLTQEQYEKIVADARYAAGMGGAWGDFQAVMLSITAFKIRDYFEKEEETL